MLLILSFNHLLDVPVSPTNKTAKEGGAVIFECYVPGADVILWRKDGDLIKHGCKGCRKKVDLCHVTTLHA